MGKLAAVLAFVAIALPCRAQVDRPIGEAYLLCRQQFKEHEQAGQIDKAIACCETFLLRYPEDTPQNRNVVRLMGSIFGKHYREPEKAQVLGARITTRFETIPTYYSLGAERLAYSFYFPPWDRSPEDLKQALEVLDDALAILGDDLPTDLIYGWRLPVGKVVTLYYLKDYEPMLAFVDEAVVKAPRILSEREVLRHIYHATNRLRPVDAARAAKLYYVLCEFDERWINEGIDFASKSLSATGGPGVALQFARSQEDPAIDNPLRDIETYDLGDPAAMLAAAGEDLEGRLNVLLYAGRIAEALELAKQQLAESAGNAGLLGRALQNFARCFKAHDVSIARANQSLHFHQTGEGENPLEALEEELEAQE